MPTESIRLSIVAHALSNDPRLAPRLAREIGYAGLQYDAYSTSLELPSLSSSGKREFRQLLSAQDRQLVGLRFDLGAKGLGPGADVDRAIDRLDAVMEAASGFQAPLVCVELGPLPEPPRVEPPKPKVSPEQAGLIIIPTSSAPEPAPRPEAAIAADPAFESQIDAALSELGGRSDRYNVVVAFRSELASFAALDRALRAAACPWFGVDLDPATVLRDEWDLDTVFSRLGRSIRHVRGRDAVRGADRRTKPAAVGQGGTEWGELLANLESADYHGWLTVDPIDLPDRAAAAGRAQVYLAQFQR